eukprot:TRINITY_DN2622_c0_g1_i1.p1 TRINITY_DN2622_c0_g1~~TRINITY_DN2622_c0_g1_i1.p1  ORF type:complete len:639 (-),score=113.37 TRINITY_DN2622_c0_g1_i1:126-2042(-)
MHWLVVLLFVLVVAAALGYLAFRKYLVARGPPPFSTAVKDPAKPLPAAPWQVFHPSRLPNLEKGEKPYDAIIVGSGLGGMSTAVCLAKAGRKVCLLEQHDVPGGCTHGFEEKGYDFETGLHYVGMLEENSYPRFWFNQMTDNQLVWEVLPDPLDTYLVCDPQLREQPRKLCSLETGWEEFQNSMAKAFPSAEDKEDVAKYLEQCKVSFSNAIRWPLSKLLPIPLLNIMIKVSPKMRHLLVPELSKTSAETMIRSLVRNPEVRAVLLAPYVNHFAPPERAPFDYHLMICYSYSFIKNGTVFPRDGTTAVAQAMCAVIKKHGGSVFVRAPVKEILLDARMKRALGVVVGRPSAAETEEEEGAAATTLRAATVVCATPVRTAMGLLPAAARKEGSPFHNQYGAAAADPSIGYMTVHAGVAHPTGEKLEVPSQIQYCLFDTDVNAGHMKLERSEPEDIIRDGWPLVYITFGSAKRPQPQGHEDKASLQILVPCPFRWFAKWKDTKYNHRPAEYEELKMLLANKLWDQAKYVFPMLKDLQVDVFKVGTPLSQNHFLGTSVGECYGTEPNIARFTNPRLFQLRPETPIKGLFLSGTDTGLHGIVGALISGITTASRLLHRNVMNELAALKVQQDAENAQKKKDS